MERVSPGHSLVEMAVNGRDDEATGILAEVVANMQPCQPVIGCATVQDWAAGFDRHADSGDLQIPQSLVEEAHRVYARLCGSQKRSALLHGDLHHDNVLFDADRGWLAIDPKGVVGEIEYEVGAALRNPVERLELFVQASTIGRRVEHFARKLNVDPGRVLAWAFAQAVLAAIWVAEDGSPVHRDHPFIALAHAIRPML
jgi:streptomycin 6-kinase